MRRRVAALAVALVIGAGSGAFAGAGPAAAGGWAVTVIDPLPGSVVAGLPHDVSFWVLQHGTHPYYGSPPTLIGRVGLVLTDGRGANVYFAGRPLAEPAHYTTTVTVPRDGNWRVIGVQGVFMPFHVGTLTVPGSLTALGVPAAPSPADMRRYWPGRVRPPVLPIDQKRDPFAPETAELTDLTDLAAQQPLPGAPVVGAEPVDEAAQRGGRAPLLVVVAAGVALVLALGGGGLGWRVRRGRVTARE